MSAIETSMVKEKLKSKATKEVALATVGGLQQAVEVLQDVSGTISLPGLQAGVGGLSIVLKMILVRSPFPQSPCRNAELKQKYNANVDAIPDLAQKVADLTKMVETSGEFHGSTISVPMQARVDRLVLYAHCLSCHKRRDN